MRKRPTAITALCWLLVAFLLFIVFVNFFIYMHPEKIVALESQGSYQLSTVKFILASSFLTSIINLILILFIFRAKNWARHFFLIYNAVLCVVALIALPHKLISILGMIVFLIILFFFYNKSAQHYFIGNSSF